ncbi:ThuA domain-containing protein [Thalassoglobus polymorphus]|uniref:Trehalose utilization n=1 Tax=Thalassoglobus polymorphus TaxID=2527994 RepID=A0A517QJK1_9PLAN|nr:ThuA domain-containing protein [Thalassoglobus polymorphus]QDT31808.1 Trehalose utilization [Thalassoglobus polymorphus]
MRLSRFNLLTFTLLTLATAQATQADELALSLRYQKPVNEEGRLFHTLTRDEVWKAEETVLIVCDVWDSHTCKNAVMRVNEMVPHLNKVVTEARNRGVTILHAPSGCMDFYQDHPARQRAINAPKSKKLPPEITQWCYKIPAEEKGVYPIDQSDGGCDDTPEEHEVWQASLAPLLKDSKWPWRREHKAISIDPKKDYISDQGDEVWNIMEDKGIKNVILTGVHTNMCVLGRPFGLRRMVENGKNAVLMRDQTDTMYNPRSEPYVSHFTGTDLIVSHIERHVCPTITSTQFIGGKEFRFSKDKRPHLAVIMAEDEYRTNETLPKYAIDPLGKHFRVTLINGNSNERNDIPGIEAIQDADALMVSIRRRVLPTADMKLIKDFVAAGKPVIGIRTASHAFSLRNEEPPAGFGDWKEFDAQVFGGNYHNHYGNKLVSMVQVMDVDHPVLKDVPRKEFKQGWSLYRTSPLKDGTTTLMTGTVEGQEPEPVTWTFKRADGGRSFYTSLGHIDDFENPAFRKMLLNGILWTLNKK